MNYMDRKRTNFLTKRQQGTYMAIILLVMIIGFRNRAHAETYIVNGTKDQPKLVAIVALAKDKNAKVERCQYKEAQDSNTGKVLCRAVELSNRGTLRLAK